MTRRDLLLHRAASLLARASVLAEAPAANLQPAPDHASTHVGPGPHGGDVHGRFLARIRRCRTDRDLEAAIGALEAEIDSVAKARPRPAVPFKTRVVTEWAGHGDAEVARVTNTPRSTVRRWRQEAGLRPADGTPIRAAV